MFPPSHKVKCTKKGRSSWLREGHVYLGCKAGGGYWIDRGQMMDPQVKFYDWSHFVEEERLEKRMCKFKEGQKIKSLVTGLEATVLMATKENYFLEWHGSLQENVIPSKIIDQHFISFPAETEDYEGTLFLIKSKNNGRIYITTYRTNETPNKRYWDAYDTLDRVHVNWDTVKGIRTTRID